MAFWVLARAELGSHGIVIKCKAAIFFCAVDYSSYKCVFSASTRAPISQFQVSYCTVMVMANVLSKLVSSVLESTACVHRVWTINRKGKTHSVHVPYSANLELDFY